MYTSIFSIYSKCSTYYVGVVDVGGVGRCACTRVIIIYKLYTYVYIYTSILM